MSVAGSSFFVDTNVLLYSLSAREPAKQAVAAGWLDLLWAAEEGQISWQVLHEFYAKAVQKLGVPTAVARSTANRYVLWSPVAPSESLLQRAWHWCDAAQINFWDALILAAAEQVGCRYLLSEDFQAGRHFGSVTVVDPFARGPDEFGLSGREQ